MISLTELKNTLTHFKFLVIPVLAIIILFLVITAQILIQLKPGLAPLELELQTPQGLPQQTSTTTVSYKGRILNIPQKMSIYTFSSSEEITNKETEKIAGNLSFAGQPQIIPAPENETIYLWRKENESLVIKPKTQRLKYEKSFQSSGLKTPSKTVNLENSINSLQNFATKITNVENTIDFAKPNYTLLEALTEGISETSLENAKFVKVSYEQLIDSIPLISNTAESSIEAILNASAEILSLNIDLSLNKSLIRKGEHPTKSFEELLQGLNSNKGIYLNSIGENIRSPTTNPSIERLTVTKARLAYLKNQQDPQLLLPVVAFEGEATLVNGNAETVLIALPVLQNTQIKSAQTNQP